MDKSTAKRIVNMLFAELEGRGGFDILNIIKDDEEVYAEMHSTCIDMVTLAAASNFDEHEHWNPRDEKGRRK